jgi:hypothetical protein
MPEMSMIDIWRSALALARRAQRQAEGGLKGRCLTCDKKGCGEPNSFAFLMTGACLMDRRGKTGGPDERMEAYFNIGWHDAHDGGRGARHPERTYVSVLDDVPLGQADLQFCSTRCLRRFFNTIVDSIENHRGKKGSNGNVGKVKRRAG